MNIDIKEFLTEEHKKQIQNKISQAIDSMDQSVITKAIEKACKEYNYEYLVDGIMEALPVEKVSKALIDPVIKIIKQKLG